MTPKDAAHKIRRLVYDPISPNETSAELENAIEAIINEMLDSRERRALQAVRDWYDRDGSVGGCDNLMEEHVEPLTVSSLPNQRTCNNCDPAFSCWANPETCRKTPHAIP